MKSGDMVRVRLPHDESGGIPCLLIGVRRDAIADVDTDPTDVWWSVIYDGEIKNIHQDYIREVISESR